MEGAGTRQQVTQAWETYTSPSSAGQRDRTLAWISRSGREGDKPSRYPLRLPRRSPEQGTFSMARSHPRPPGAELRGRVFEQDECGRPHPQSFEQTLVSRSTNLTGAAAAGRGAGADGDGYASWSRNNSRHDGTAVGRRASYQRYRDDRGGETAAAPQSEA